MVVGEDSGESFRELIARVPCETIVTAPRQTWIGGRKLGGAI